MTTAETIRDSKNQTQSQVDPAVRLATRISRLAINRRGDVAGLRRMDPTHPDVGVFWRLMAEQGIEVGDEREKKWALIIHGIALMTPRASGGNNPRSAHDGSMPVGRALFLGGEPRRQSGFYSESRLNRLLTSRSPMFQTLLARMFRMLASRDAIFDWWEMAQFILNEGSNEDASEKSCRRIAREYYQAEWRSSQTTD